MGVNTRFQIRWIVNSAIICIFASSIMLIFLQLFLDRALGHDYYKAYYTLKDLDASVLLLISTPTFIYILLSSILVVFFKLFISHKIAGPIFRFEKCAASLGSGDLDFSTKLRAGDQLNGLAQTLNELKDSLAGPLQSTEDGLRRMEALIEAMERSAGEGHGKEIERHLKDFEEELAGMERRLRPETGETV